MLIDAMFENPAHMTELMGIKEVDALVLPEERIDAAQLKTAVDACRAAGKKCIIQMPYVFRNAQSRDYLRREKELLLAGADGWLVRSIENCDRKFG